MAIIKTNRYAWYFILLTGVLLIAAGCKKYNAGPAPMPAGKKLVRIQEGTTGDINFEYNTDGTLKKVSGLFDTGGGGTTFSINISYKPNKEIDEVTNTKGFKTAYFYSDGLVQKMEQRDLAGMLVRVKNLFYENEKLHRSVTSFPPAPGAAPQATATVKYYYYTIHEKDVREAVHYERNPVTGQIDIAAIYKYEAYDNKKNPYTLLGDFGLAFFDQVTKSNPLNEIVYDKDYIPGGSNENTYTYDEHDFPITLTQTITRNQMHKTITTKYTYN